VERQAIADACEIAGIKCLRVINESTAIVYNYGFFRKNDLDPEKERVVAFVDVGHSKTTITIAAFKRGEARIIIHNSDRNLGGRDFDDAVLDVIGGEFAKKYGDDPRKSARCRIRLYEACEKARKLLSSDTESQLNVEYLLNEEDLVRKLSREEFEKINEPTLIRFRDLLQDTLNKAGLTPDKIEVVEMIGDSTRAPCILNITKDVFQQDKLDRTLNSLECVARGAALNAAMLTPGFSVQQFKMSDYNSTPVKVSYCFHEDGKNDEMKAYPDFFKLGQKFPMSQELSFNNKEGDLTLAIDYDQTTPQLQGLPLTISQHKISKGKRAKADVPGSKVRLVIVLSNNHNQIPTLFDVKLVENWQEEEKIPIKTGPPKAAAPPKEEKKAEDGEKKEGEGDAAGADDKKEAEKVDETQQDQKYETKIKNRERTTQITFTTISHAVPPDGKKRMRGLEDQMYAEDRELLDIKEAKYNLESYMYEMKNGVGDYGNYEHYIDPKIKAQFI
jgi:heat shock protein 4